MAKKTTYSMEDMHDVFRTEQAIEIEGETSILIVECKINRRKATYAITSKLTTKQVHSENEGVNRATLLTLNEMTLKVIEEAEIRRDQILSKNRQSDSIKFPEPDNTLPFEAAEEEEPDGTYTSPGSSSEAMELILTDEMNAGEKRAAKTRFVAEWIEKNPDAVQFGAREIARRIDHKAINNQFVGRVLKTLESQEGA